MHNTVLLRKCGARKITVQREDSDGKGGKKVLTRNFEVRESGSFPNSNSKSGNGVTAAELALATRAFFQLRHPEKLMGEGRVVHARAQLAVDLDPAIHADFSAH